MEWMILPFKRYADFKGRSRRKEFWLFQLLYWIISAAFIAVNIATFPWGFSGAQDEDGTFGFETLLIAGMLLYGVWFFATLIPFMAVTVRRLHDRGESGLWYAGLLVLGFVPILNGLVVPGYLVLLVFLCLPGEEVPNKWGASPKDPGQASVFR